jgi:ArsR family transcriptional regulator
MDIMLDRCEVECLHPDHVAPLLGRVLEPAAANHVAATFSILADTTRARILHALTLVEELCVCDMSFLLGVSQSALSHQLKLLRENRVVARRKAGRIAYYGLADAHVRHIFLDGARHAVDEAEDP